MFVFSENVCRFAQILNKAFFRESMGVKALKIKLLAVVMLCSFSGFGYEDSTDKKQEEFNPKEMIMHHVKDAYGFHLWDWNGHSIALPLPVLLWVDGEMITFMSSEFHHDSNGEVIVERNGHRFVNFHEKVYQLDSGLDVSFSNITFKGNKESSINGGAINMNACHLHPFFIYLGV